MLELAPEDVARPAPTLATSRQLRKLDGRWRIPDAVSSKEDGQALTTIPRSQIDSFCNRCLATPEGEKESTVDARDMVSDLR
ncbi:hypothetical protein MTO96_013676 [Rhipicephalus appendiculatus]